MSAIDIDPTKVKLEDYKDTFEAAKTYEEAWNHPCPFQRKLWRESINKELRQMEELGVWKKIKRSEMPRDRRCIKHKWVFEIKRSGKFRSRLVACGYSQLAGIDFNYIYSPVGNDMTFRTMIVYQIMHKMNCLVFDVSTAFLHGKLKEEIYMDCPEGTNHSPDECVKLLKTLYGLVQSAREYYLVYKNILVDKLGFVNCEADPCLFIKKDRIGTVVIFCHVDDSYAIYDNKEAMDVVLKGLPKHGLKTTIESAKDYLSCEIDFNDTITKAWMGQPHMVKKLLKTFGDEVRKLQKYRTPGTPGQALSMAEEKDRLPAEQHAQFCTGTGMLLFLIKYSRPDLCNCVRELSKVLSSPNHAAYKEILRIIKYVLDTPLRGLKLSTLDSSLTQLHRSGRLYLIRNNSIPVPVRNRACCSAGSLSFSSAIDKPCPGVPGVRYF